jgi:cobalt/nickel transport system permease protein
MHIIDGALDMAVVSAGALCALGGLGYGLKRLPLDLIPTAGVISAALFVASLVHVPVGLTSVHLVLNGLAGLVLGWAVFPVVFVALLLQAIFFWLRRYYGIGRQYREHGVACGACVVGLTRNCV